MRKRHQINLYIEEIWHGSLTNGFYRLIRKLKVMKQIKFYLVGLLVLAGASAFSQESPARRGLSLSIGPEMAIPLGSFRNGMVAPGTTATAPGYKVGFGGSAKLNIPVATNLDVSLSAGYIGFSQKGLGALDSLHLSKNSYTFVPFKAGLRIRTNGGFYIEPQAGYTVTKISNQQGAGYFTYAGNVGYMIGRSVDIAVRYEAVASSGESLKFLGLRVAYSFPFARVRRAS